MTVFFNRVPLLISVRSLLYQRVSRYAEASFGETMTTWAVAGRVLILNLPYLALLPWEASMEYLLEVVEEAGGLP